jgi:hypothetical protein
VPSIWVKRGFRKGDREAGCLLLIHCGYALGQAAIAPDIGEIANKRRMKLRKPDKKKPGGGMAVPAN